MPFSKFKTKWLSDMQKEIDDKIKNTVKASL